MTHDPDQYNELVQPNVSLIMDDGYGGDRDDSSSDDNDGTTTGMTTNKNQPTPHDIVCKFIEESVKVVGLDVEVTGVEYHHHCDSTTSIIVDKAGTEALAASLGVKNPMRWRPYFP